MLILVLSAGFGLATGQLSVQLGVIITILGALVLAPLFYFFHPRLFATDEPTGAPMDPLETLKHRYAEGDLSEEEFERRLDRLVALEDVELERSRE